MKPLRIGLGIDHRCFMTMKSRKEGAYLLRQFWTVLLALGLNLYSLASSPTPRDPLVEELRLLDANAADLLFDYEASKRLHAEMNQMVRDGDARVTRDREEFQQQLDKVRVIERENRNAYYVGLEARQQRLEELRQQIRARVEDGGATRRSEAMAMAVGVRDSFVAANLKPGMNMMATAHVFREASEIMRTAEILSHSLIGGVPADEAGRSRHVEDLVHLASLAAGQRKPICAASYRPGLEQGQFGDWNPWRGIRISGSTLEAMSGSLHFQFYVACHEVIHALDFKEFESTQLVHVKDPYERLTRQGQWMDRLAPRLPIVRDSAERLKLSREDEKTLRKQLGEARNELRTDNRAWQMTRVVMVRSSSDVAGENSRYREMQKERIREVHEFIRSQVQKEGGTRYANKLQECLNKLGFSLRDRIGNFERTITGPPIFGGVILGGAMDGAGLGCEGIGFVERDGHWFVRLRLNGATGSFDADYDPGSLDDLWAAYHIVRPTDGMRVMGGLQGRESSLVTCEPLDVGGFEVALHPALRTSPISYAMLGLEMAAVAALREHLKARDAVDRSEMVAIQWHDTPSKLELKGGVVRVVNLYDPKDPVLTIRAIALDSTSLEKDEQSSMVAVSEALVQVIEGRNGNLGTEEFNRIVGKEVLSRSRMAFTNLASAELRQMSALRSQELDFGHLDRFARTLSLLNWAADQLADRFPRWPDNLHPFPAWVPEDWNPAEAGRFFSSDRRSSEVRELLEPLAKGRDGKGSQWYKLLEDGINRGVLRVLNSSTSESRGIPGTQREWDLYRFRSILGQTALERESGEVVVDRQGRVLQSVLERATGAGGHVMRIESVRRENRIETRVRGGTGQERALTSPLQDGPAIVAGSLLTLGGLGERLNSGERQEFKSLVFRKEIMAASLGDQIRIEASMLNPTSRVMRYRMGNQEVVIDWDDRHVPEVVLGFGQTVTFVPVSASDALRAEGIFPSIVEPTVPVTGAVIKLDRRYALQLRMKAGNGDRKIPTSEWGIRESSVGQMDLVNSASLMLGHSPTAAADQAQRIRWAKPGQMTDSDHPRIRQFAVESLNAQDSNQALVVCGVLEQRVRQFVEGSYGQRAVKASEILDAPVGDCKHYAILLCAICKAAGIPARVVGGIVMSPGGRSGVPHAWVQAMFDGRWYRLDSALPKGQMVYVPLCEIENVDDLKQLELVGSIEGIHVTDLGEMENPFQWIGPDPTVENLRMMAGLGFCLGYYRALASEMVLQTDVSEDGLREVNRRLKTIQQCWDSMLQRGVPKGIYDEHQGNGSENMMVQLCADGFGYSMESRRAAAVDAGVAAAFSIPALIFAANSPTLKVNDRLKKMTVSRFKGVLETNPLPSELVQTLGKAFQEALDGSAGEAGSALEEVGEFAEVLVGLIGQSSLKAIGDNVSP